VIGVLALILAAAVPAGFEPPAPPAPAMVVVVRHAEKAPAPKGDPVLSAVGEERARRLVTLLGHSKPTSLWATQLQRTQLTLAPLAAATGQKVETLPADDTKILVETLRQRRDRLTVVAGHSNTVPEILRGLGADFSEPELGEDEYHRLFIVSLPEGDGPAGWIELAY
jgi:hypothetical protein